MKISARVDKSAKNVAYRAKVNAQATEEEIQNTLRTGTEVTLSRIEVVTT